MIKMLAVFILAVFAIGCRTMIDPGTTHPPRTLEEIDKVANKDNRQRVIVHVDKKPLTEDEIAELKRRYYRHVDPTLVTDIDIVTNKDDECQSDSDWICPVEDGVWACYCKLNNQRRR